MPKGDPKGGRPTKFEERFCEMLIEHRKQGLSYESFAATIGVDRATLYHWENDHPTFFDAKKRAKDVSLKSFEQMGIALATGKLKGNTAAWIFLMKNQHSDTYRETPEITDETIDGILFDE